MLELAAEDPLLPASTSLLGSEAGRARPYILQDANASSCKPVEYLFSAQGYSELAFIVNIVNTPAQRTARWYR
jgi:hypothetical protein